MKQSRMFKNYRAVLSALMSGLSLFLLLPCIPACAQSACAQLGVNCSHNYSSGYGGGYRYNPGMAAYYRQLRAQRALQRRHNLGYSNNQSGLTALNRGNYDRAVKLFRKAHSYWPDDQTIYNNLQYALNQQAQQRSYKRYQAQQKKQAQVARKLAAQQQKEAAKLALQRQKEAAKLARLHPPAPASSNTPAVASSSLFGRPSNPANPGLQAMPPSTACTDTHAMDQLKAMAATSIQ